MAVQVFGDAVDIDGHEKSMGQLRSSHAQNTAGLLNHAEGRKVDAPRPQYDPKHAHNAWPKAVYHPAKGTLVIGKSLKGITDKRLYDQTAEENQQALDKALSNDQWSGGYRMEPYPKPQIAVHDAAVEKQQMLDRQKEQDGKITMLTDLVSKLLQKPVEVEEVKDKPKT